MVREVAVFSFPLGKYTTNLPRYGENALDDKALNQAGLLIDVFNGYFLQSDSKPDNLNESKRDLLSHLDKLGSSFSHFSDNDVSSRGVLPEGTFFCNHSFPGQHRYSISFHVSEHQYLLYLYVEQNPNQNYTAPLSPTSPDGSLEDHFRRSLGSVLDEPDMLSHKQFCNPFSIQRKAQPLIAVNYFYPGYNIYNIYNIYYTNYQGQIIYFNLSDDSSNILSQFMNPCEKYIALTALYIFENNITSGNLQQYAHGYPSHTFLFDDYNYQNVYDSFANQPVLRSYMTYRLQDTSCTIHTQDPLAPPNSGFATASISVYPFDSSENEEITFFTAPPNTMLHIHPIKTTTTYGLDYEGEQPLQIEVQ